MPNTTAPTQNANRFATGRGREMSRATMASRTGWSAVRRAPSHTSDHETETSGSHLNIIANRTVTTAKETSRLTMCSMPSGDKAQRNYQQQRDLP